MRTAMVLARGCWFLPGWVREGAEALRSPFLPPRLLASGSSDRADSRCMDEVIARTSEEWAAAPSLGTSNPAKAKATKGGGAGRVCSGRFVLSTWYTAAVPRGARRQVWSAIIALAAGAVLCLLSSWALAIRAQQGWWEQTERYIESHPDTWVPASVPVLDWPVEMPGGWPARAGRLAARESSWATLTIATTPGPGPGLFGGRVDAVSVGWPMRSMQLWYSMEVHGLKTITLQ
jgi:hypothetical protein